MFTTESQEFKNWFELLKTRCKEYHEKFDFVYAPDFDAQETSKNIKVWSLTNDGKRASIIAFINRETGDIFKPASTKAPAKHARGNIASEKGGLESFGDGYQIRYL